MNNEQMYRQKLLAWYDQTRKHFPKDYEQDLALRELQHFIDTLRPADDESPAGDVLQEKLAWVKPKPREPQVSRFISRHYFHTGCSLPLLGGENVIPNDDVSER